MNHRLSVPASLFHAPHRSRLVPAMFMAIVLIAAAEPVIAAETTAPQPQSKKSIESASITMAASHGGDDLIAAIYDSIIDPSMEPTS